MASPPRSPVTLSRLRACSAQLLGLRAFGDFFGSSTSAGASAADDASGGCRESVERSEDCVVVTREGVRLLRCTETLRRLRTCVNTPAPQEIEVVEGTTLRRLGGGGGGVGTTAATAATTAPAPATANNNSSGGPPPVLAPPGGGSIVLNPEASEALQEFMGFADHLESERGRRA